MLLLFLLWLFDFCNVGEDNEVFCLLKFRFCLFEEENGGVEYSLVLIRSVEVAVGGGGVKREWWFVHDGGVGNVSRYCIVDVDVDVDGGVSKDDDDIEDGVPRFFVFAVEKKSRIVVVCCFIFRFQ